MMRQKTNDVCIYMSDVSRHCESDKLTHANADLSFVDRPQQVHLHSVFVVSEYV